MRFNWFCEANFAIPSRKLHKGHDKPNSWRLIFNVTRYICFFVLYFNFLYREQLVLYPRMDKIRWSIAEFNLFSKSLFGTTLRFKKRFCTIKNSIPRKMGWWGKRGSRNYCWSSSWGTWCHKYCWKLWRWHLEGKGTSFDARWRS